jgi:caffeoyl-CoA O-methyltransferase
VLPKLAPGGFVVANSVLWKGHVLDESRTDAETTALAAFNDRVAGDPSLDVVMLTVGEGLTLIRPRS